MYSPMNCLSEQLANQTGNETNGTNNKPNDFVAGLRSRDLDCTAIPTSGSELNSKNEENVMSGTEKLAITGFEYNIPSLSYASVE